MTTFAVVSKQDKSCDALAKSLSRRLNAGGDPRTARRLGIHVEKNPDTVFVIGGDGTVLHSEHAYPGVPKVPIGFGRVSFLSDVKSTDNLDLIVRRVLEKKYFLEERSKLSCSLLPDALNEVALLKTHPDRMIELSLLIDGKEAGTIRGDGIVVSTPTGSTAYALSCGGPILPPDTCATAIVPIAPFKLASRPMVVSDDSKITIVPITDAIVSVDGRKDVRVHAGKKVDIFRSSTPARFVRFEAKNFFEKLKLLH